MKGELVNETLNYDTKNNLSQKFKLLKREVQVKEQVSERVVRKSLFKKRLQQSCFPVKYAKFLRAPF